MSRVYLAGPLFTDGERELNQKITNLLEENGYEVFLPQRDGMLAAEMQTKTSEEVSKSVFQTDTGALMQCDILLFVTDGRVPDEGGCVELGMAYGMGKRCYGVRTDSRVLLEVLPLNPLIRGCFLELFEASGEDELLRILKEYVGKKPL